LIEADFKHISDQVAKTLPQLKGKLIEGENEGGFIMKGLWGMNDAAHKHSPEKNTSDWELNRTDPVLDSPSGFDGKYSGFFMLRTKVGFTQIADSVQIKFCPVQGEPIFVGKVKQAWRIIGKGKNSFGKFRIQGHLASDNSVQIYKLYEPAQTPTAGLKRRKSEGAAGRSRGLILCLLFLSLSMHIYTYIYVYIYSYICFLSIIMN